MTTMNPDSFNDAYRILQRNAETLRRQTEPDIDSLVPLVEELTLVPVPVPVRCPPNPG